MAILQMTELSKLYSKGGNQVLALDGLTLSVEEGEFTAIVGPSGSGKTTLLNIMGCLDIPSSGTVLYGGTNLGTASERELAAYRRSHISFIFQSYNLVPVLTVRENVELPLLIERKLGKADIRARADELIAAVGLSDKAKRFPRELSGGQEQRVAIARALVKQPLVVLADEPTANLDSHTAEDIMELMHGINEKKGTTFIFSTHDKLVMEKARRVITLRDGRISAEHRS